MPELVLRPAQVDDAEQIARLLRDVGWFAHVNREDPAATTARVERHLRLCGADASHTVLVAVASSGPVLGYVSVHWLPYLFLSGIEGFVSELFVAEGARDRGVGTRLLDAVRSEGQQRGVSRLMLINGRNRLSYERGFYSQRGWEERPDMANFVFFPTAPADPAGD